MKILKKSFALLLTTAFCLGLTACGSSDDVAGEDWRTTGVVVGSGTITHTGEGSVDVLVTVDENSAAFYRDEQNQILFDSVAFPMTISDAKKSFNDISFDDINGDGESDVCVSFVYAPGEYADGLGLGCGGALCVSRGAVHGHHRQRQPH